MLRGHTLKGTPAARLGPLYYNTVTRRCIGQIEQFATEARHQSGPESRYRYERAYGLYLGWRALVMDQVPDAVFARDDAILEALLPQLPHGPQAT